jgi:hypothetical protein
MREYFFRANDVDGVIESADETVALILDCKYDASGFSATHNNGKHHLKQFLENIDILVGVKRYKKVHVGLIWADGVVQQLELQQYWQRLLATGHWPESPVSSELLFCPVTDLWNDFTVDKARIQSNGDWSYMQRKVDLCDQHLVLIRGARGVGKTELVRQQFRPNILLDLRDWTVEQGNTPTVLCLLASLSTRVSTRAFHHDSDLLSSSSHSFQPRIGELSSFSSRLARPSCQPRRPPPSEAALCCVVGCAYGWHDLTD